MPNTSRQMDMWTGICCCHPPVPCIPMVGYIIGSSPNVTSGGMKQGMTTHMTIGACGHPGMIVTGSPTLQSNGMGDARVGDLVTGCNIGVIITGNSTHIVN